MQGITFFDGPLTEVCAGLPRHFKDNTYISRAKQSNIPIIPNYSTVQLAEFEPGRLYINITRFPRQRLVLSQALSSTIPMMSRTTVGGRYDK